MRTAGSLQRSCAAFALLPAVAACAGTPFRIQVIDAATRRGVPLVELSTTNQCTFVTDSAGVVAFDDPALMGLRVHFSIRSHGYTCPRDGFGYAGVVLDVSPGGSATIELQRVNIAERLYRVTGAGIYRDSVLLGDRPPLARPLLNGRVMGQDSVVVSPYRGKLYWFWGDTARPDYPLGNFEVSGATSELPARGGLDPEIGVDLEYFVDSTGFSRPMCPIPGPGPVWIDGLVTVPNDRGEELLVAHFVRVKNLGEIHERGLAAFRDQSAVFEPLVALESAAPLHPRGHPFRAVVAGTEYFFFPAPFPNVRVRARLADLTNPAAYEAFTCLAPGSRGDAEPPALDRDASGQLVYGWKAGTAPVEHGRQMELIRRGLLQPEEAWLQLQDVDSGGLIQTHGGSVFYNAWRRRWIMIALQQGGATSLLGEVWFAEADTTLGPWVYARKIVTHDDYSFYNVTQHPYFDADGGRRIYFEGTYTAMFSGTRSGTPRYDYNQVMYGLSLDDPRLILPVPVYAVAESPGRVELLTGEAVTQRHAWDRVKSIEFFAMPPDRPREDLVAVVATIDAATGTQRLAVQSSANVPAGAQDRVVFRALPPDLASPPATVVPLFEHQPAGIVPHTYRTHAATDAAEDALPLCFVWRSPPAPMILAPEIVPADVR